MSSIIDEAEIEEPHNTYPPLFRKQIAQLSVNLRKVSRVVDRRIDILRDTLDEARDAFLALSGRVETLEVAAVVITVVQTVADLPPSASRREWFRVAQGTLAERATVYVGNGQGSPLTKLVPAAL